MSELRTSIAVPQDLVLQDLQIAPGPDVVEINQIQQFLEGVEKAAAAAGEKGMSREFKCEERKGGCRKNMSHGFLHYKSGTFQVN